MEGQEVCGRSLLPQGNVTHHSLTAEGWCLGLGCAFRVADALRSGRGALTSSPSSPFSTPAKPAGTPHLCAPAGHKPITENVLDANKLSR